MLRPYGAESEDFMANRDLLRLLELIKIYDEKGVLEDEFKYFATDEESPLETVDDLIEAMESEMSYWDN